MHEIRTTIYHTPIRNIENPLARVAIKRLVAPNGGFVFVSENKVYGKENFAKAALFN